MSKLELYRTVSSRVGKGVKIKKSLCFYSPEEVYKGLASNPDIKKWHNFMAKTYVPERKDVLLIYPCSTVKPYNRSRSYQQLYQYLDRLNGKREQIQVMTISEPFGLVPDQYFSGFEWYDCPGLFEWWCRRYKQEYDKEYLDRSIEIISDNVGKTLKRVGQEYKKIIACVRTYSSALDQKDDHTHRRMLELASRRYHLDIEILPTKNQIKNLVNERGTFAWDMYGVAHPKVLKSLLRQIKTT